MAKRYKEKTKKKFKIKNILICIIFIILFAVIIIGVKQKWFDFDHIKQRIKDQEEQEISFELFQNITKKVEENRKLTSNLLKPSELNNEIDSMINEEEENKDNNYIVKIQYKLKDLNTGTIDIYYKAGKDNLIKMVVNIENKEIESTEKYEDKELVKKDKIRNNLEENIEEDFNKRKEKLNSEYEVVNIIITNTEIVINTGVE